LRQTQLSFVIHLGASAAQMLFTQFDGLRRSGYNSPRSAGWDPTMKKKRILSQYIVADPEICHGQPTFIGTRVMVCQVLKQVARGMDWDTIVWQWRGSVPREAIAEAVRLAGEAFAAQTRLSARKSRTA
jgi:uncharacterized protein (DUF433 family)